MYRHSRQGTILPLLAVCLVALLGFVALSIDVGLMAMARTQCQNAADCAALTGARTLSGNQSANDNYANCAPAARLAVSANQVQGVYLNGNDTTNVVVNVGSYAYNPTTSLFQINLPKNAGDPYDLVQVNITSPSNATFFARVFNISSYSMSATATAAHRPRDVALAVDTTGSMRFASCLGIPAYGAVRNNGGSTASGSNNPESVYPTFGQYSSSTAALQFTSSVTINGDLYAPGNISEADSSDQNRPAIVGDFYQNTPYTTPLVPAFNNTVNSNGPTPPADSSLDSYNCASGDKALHISKNSSNGFATTVKDVTGSTTKNSTFESNSATGGYTYFYTTGTPTSAATFQGYTQGPRYWGKTFFTWPPDPRWGGGTQAPDPTKLSTSNLELDTYGNYICDWRRRFFGTNDNTKLWDSNGNWQTPTAGGYTINYNAIMAWLAASPNPFPSQMIAGHIQYYSSMPTTINTSTFPVSDPSQRFWKEYIDHCLGLWQYNSSTWYVITPYVGYGDDFAWGTVQISAPPTGTGATYMSYTDNPRRPRTHFWFGPMTMVDFIGNFNMDRWWMPGDCHESPLYSCKLGLQAALSDAQNNHPNDYLSLIMFSFPMGSAGDTTDIAGPCRFNAVRVPLSTNYSLMQSSLWFPPETLNADGSDNQTVITPYSTANSDVPRASGTTCYSMPLMLAFNQFQSTSSSDTTLRKWITPSASVPEGMAGGEGRKGAQKMIIFCTDGIPNTKATCTLNTSGSPNYYPIRYNAANQGGSQYPTVTYVSDNDSGVCSEVYGICSQLNTTYSTPRKPFRLYTLGFGPVFDTTNPNQAACLQTLQTMQYNAGTQSSASTPLPSFQIVTGTPAQMSSSLQTAITTIMQGAIQVVLLQ